MNILSYEKLTRSFYERPNVVQIAQDLLGKILFTQVEGIIAAGRIVETEAYNGREDKACHTFLKRTKRTEIMYGHGGTAYIYLCYGIHHLFNIVTNKEGLADAILIRGIDPLMGIEEMQKRRNNHSNLGAGPGVLTKSMGLTKGQTGIGLESNEIWIANDPSAEPFNMVTDVRIGIDYAEEDAFLPWRFYVDGSKNVSKMKKLR